MLVRQLSTISPAMTLLAALETTRLHRGAGLTGNCTVLVRLRPVRVPHHTISDAGLIGGGQSRCLGKCRCHTMMMAGRCHDRRYRYPGR